jgi:hypothetical protein
MNRSRSHAIEAQRRVRQLAGNIVDRSLLNYSALQSGPFLAGPKPHRKPLETGIWT